MNYVRGDMFLKDKEKNYDIMINTVNIVGVMGKGIALEFKNRYPAMFKEYKELCNKKELEIGSLYIYQTEDNKLIINLPTKTHYKYNSEYEYIEKGCKCLKSYLNHLVNDYNMFLKEKGKVAIPPLGCGCGNLDFEEVNKIYIKYLPKLQKNYDIDLYVPRGY